MEKAAPEPTLAAVPDTVWLWDPPGLTEPLRVWV